MKHNKTRITAYLMTFVVILTSINITPISIKAADTLKSGFYEYSVNGQKATITKYTGAESALTIPESLGGYEIEAIGYGDFQRKESLTSVTIPGNVKSIGSNAF